MKKLGLMVVVIFCMFISNACITTLKSGPNRLDTSDPNVANKVSEPTHPFSQYPLKLLETCKELAEKNPGARVEITAEGDCRIVPVGSAQSAAAPSPSALTYDPDSQSFSVDPDTKALSGIWENYLSYPIKVQIFRPGEQVPSTTLRISSNSFQRFKVYPNLQYRWVVRNSSGKEVDSGTQQFSETWGDAHSALAGEDADVVQSTRTDFWGQG